MNEADRIAALEQALAEARATITLYETALTAMPQGVLLADSTGHYRIFNAAARAMAGTPRPDILVAQAATAYGLFHADGKTPLARSPTASALAGEETHDGEVFVRNPEHPEGVRVAIDSFTLRAGDGTLLGALSVLRDVTAQRALDLRLSEHRAALEASEREKTETLEQLRAQLATIDAQRLAIQQLSTPILEVWDDVLALPVVGVVDSQRAAQMMERLLEEVVRRQARTVIIDLTGVEVVDTKTADYFLKVIRAVELLGARCSISGIRPAVAQTLVELGVDLGAIRTSRNLKHALRDSLRPGAKEASLDGERRRVQGPSGGAGGSRSGGAGTGGA
jgi:rsbT co-antagonist protein RsbR